MIFNPAHCIPELPHEHQYVEIPFPVLFQLIAAGGGEVLLAYASRLLYHHLVLSRLPIFQAFPNPPPDCLFTGHVAHVLQNHRPEDYEMLHVAPTRPHSP